jgi:fucose permease
MDQHLKHRGALFIVFGLPGVIISTWASRTPGIRDALAASTQEMGIVLFGMSIGAFAGVFFSPRFVNRSGTKQVIVAGGWGCLIGLFLIGLGAYFSTAAIAFIGFVLVGGGMGTLEIGANLQAAALESVLRRPVLTTMHGFYSLGMVFGSVLGIACNALSIPIELHFGLIIGACLPFCIYALKTIPGHEFDVRANGDQQAVPMFSLLQDRHLLALGLVVLAAALAEGAANDWLPLILVDGHGFDQTWSSVSFAAFASAMAVGRFLGPFILRYVTKEAALRGSVFVSAIGLAVVVLAPSPQVAGLAVVLWGAGAAPAFPLTLSIAGSDSNGDARVGLVAQLGYMAFLVGPPLLGFLGEHYGLRNGMTVVFVALFVAAALIPRPRVVQAAAE